MNPEDQTGRCVHVCGELGCVRNRADLWDRLRLAQRGTLFAWRDTHLRWEECELARVFRERQARHWVPGIVLSPEEEAILRSGEYEIARPAGLGSRVFALCEETDLWIECELKPVPNGAMRVLEAVAVEER